MIRRLMETSTKVGEVLHGKYQVNEIDILLNTFKDSLVNLKSSVEIEMELSRKMRMIGQIKLKNSVLESEIKKQDDLIQTTKASLKMYKETNREIQGEIMKLRKIIGDQEKKNKIQASKIDKLEKRIEILLESSYPVVNPEDKLRSALSEIMKENER